jgi:hypothetical protein
MKALWIILFILISGIAGCEKAKNNNPTIPDGMYTGTFQRILSSEDVIVSNVMISFLEGKWSGQSDIPKYPALCNGSFKMQGNKLVFSNDCAWTADFDWSLILSGEYDYNLVNDSLIIQKDYGTPTVYHDIYRLSIPKTGIKQSPMLGTWVESIKKTDTIVFSPDYDGIYPIFNLKRGFRISEGYTLPNYFSGPYWYILGRNSISVSWFLSSSSLYKRYHFNVLPGGKMFEIGNFFTDPTIPPVMDTLTFVKIN